LRAFRSWSSVRADGMNSPLPREGGGGHEPKRLEAQAPLSEGVPLGGLVGDLGRHTFHDFAGREPFELGKYVFEIRRRRRDPGPHVDCSPASGLSRLDAGACRGKRGTASPCPKLGTGHEKRKERTPSERKRSEEPTQPDIVDASSLAIARCALRGLAY